MREENNSKSTIVIEREAWLNEDKTVLFGVPKSVHKQKEKTPGMMAMLIHEESFANIKHFAKELKQHRPVIDLPELTSAAIDLCLSTPDLRRQLELWVVTAREKMIAESKSRLQKTIAREPS